MLIMLTFLGTLVRDGGGGGSASNQEKINMMNISLCFSNFFQNMLKTGEMLSMLIMLILMFEKVAKTGQLLIMLIMLIFWGLGGGAASKKRKKINKINIPQS